MNMLDISECLCSSGRLNKMKFARISILIVALIFAVSCGLGQNGIDHVAVPPVNLTPTLQNASTETAVQEIPLTGRITESIAEVSSLAWYGENNEWLIIVPQYPSRFSNRFYMLEKGSIISFLNGEIDGPLDPIPLPVIAPGVNQLSGYEGFEALLFDGQTVYATIEAQVRRGMRSYLIQGEISPDLSGITFSAVKPTIIQAQTDLDNYSDESLLMFQEELITIYEANGANVNEAPQAGRFALDRSALESYPFPNVEYRITDATQPDENNRFWAINYLYSGDVNKLAPADDEIWANFGVGDTHLAAFNRVERLVEFEIDGANGRIELTDTPPIQLQLVGSRNERNWEGIVRLEEAGLEGFLIMTDEFPKTILGFVKR